MGMTRLTQRLTVLAALAALAYVAASLSQPVERKPAPTHPIELTSGVRAVDRTTVTPNFSRMTAGLYGKQIVQSASANGDQL
jgi:hypothetical protein